MSREVQDGNNTLTYVLPDVVDPPDTICVTLHIPNNKFHIMAFKGAIWDLCNWWNWEKDDAHTATLVAKVWRRIFRSMKFVSCDQPQQSSGISLGDIDMSELIDISCDSNGNCRFGYRCNVCDTFNYVQNADNPPSVTPPTSQPGPGACTTFDMLVHGNSRYLSGVQVSSGDTITVTGIKGAWSDDGLLNWYCATGFAFQLGFCNPLEPSPVTGTDPLVASKHMILIAYDGANYYDATAPFTINPGVNNANLTFQANDSVISDNSGDIVAHVQVCKSMTPPASDGVYWATYGYPQVGYPTWTKIDYGVLTTLTSAPLGTGNGTDIVIAWCTGGQDAHGQPVHTGQACFNLTVVNFTGYVNAPFGSSYIPCTSCVPGSLITPVSSFAPGEYGFMQIAAIGATFSMQVVIVAC